MYDLSTALELDWHENVGLCREGEAESRQVEGGRVGLSIDQGLFGHGSCVIGTR